VEVGRVGGGRDGVPRRLGPGAALVRARLRERGDRYLGYFGERVVNPSWLPDLLAGDGATRLSAKQIDLCARQLEQRCRDVEY
jgi:hypothetical protein